MSFNDDEPVVADIPGEVENHVSFPAGKTTLTVTNETEAPLEKTDFTALIQLTGPGGVDLVIVLDVSESMTTDGKIEKMKNAVEFVVRKLRPVDRLSVVTFSDGAARLYPLRQVTDKSRLEMEALVDALNAGGNANITEGLKVGLRVLKERRLSSNRVAAIMLMSDGQQNQGGDVSQVLVDDVPIHTFGFSSSSDSKALLKSIAEKSKGGTFSDVNKQSNLTIALSRCLSELDTVDVLDLKLKIATYPGASAIEKVEAGRYRQIKDDDGSVTVMFGDLFVKEVPEVFVDLTLPEVTKRISQDILEISYSYKKSSDGNIFDASPVIVTVTRKGSDPTEQPKKEEIRLRAAGMIQKARKMVNENIIGMFATPQINTNIRRSINTSASFTKNIIHIPHSSNLFVTQPRPFGLRLCPCPMLSPSRLSLLSRMPTLAHFR